MDGKSRMFMLGIKNVLLCHTKDMQSDKSRSLYSTKAMNCYDGHAIVLNELEEV